MGVDAELYFVTPSLSNQDQKAKTYIFGQAFHDKLWLGNGDKVYHQPLEWMEGTDNDNWMNIPIPSDHILCKVPVGGRFYGEGYERGPIMDYIIMAEFIEKLFPDCVIYYFGDSGGCDEWSEFNKARRDALMNYFITHNGHENYQRAFDRENKGPNCPNCDVRMVQHGFGQNYALYCCHGCGWSRAEKDGVVKNGFDVSYNSFDKVEK